jgi:hypothetical protein
LSGLVHSPLTIAFRLLFYDVLDLDHFGIGDPFDLGHLGTSTPPARGKANAKANYQRQCMRK